MPRNPHPNIGFSHIGAMAQWEENRRIRKFMIIQRIMGIVILSTLAYLFFNVISDNPKIEIAKDIHTIKTIVEDVEVTTILDSEEMTNLKESVFDLVSKIEFTVQDSIEKRNAEADQQEDYIKPTPPEEKEESYEGENLLRVN